MEASAEILCVDDDPVDIENLRRAFARCGGANPVRTVQNGAEALALLRGERQEVRLRPAIILLDLSMPGLGGLELLKQVKCEPELRSIPVVVLSASRHDRDIRTAYALGVAGYFVKPMDFAGFVRAITAIEQYWALCELPGDGPP